MDSDTDTGDLRAGGRCIIIIHPVILLMIRLILVLVTTSVVVVDRVRYRCNYEPRALCGRYITVD